MASLSKSSKSHLQGTISNPYLISPLSPATPYTSSASNKPPTTPLYSHPANSSASFLSSKNTSKKYAQALKQQQSFQLQRPPRFAATPPTPPQEQHLHHTGDDNGEQPDVPPPVTPYTLTNRRDKSLEDKLCCVCEERIEYTFDGERIIVLECSHVCHVACLDAFYVETLYMTRDQIEALKKALSSNTLQDSDTMVPECPTCGEPAIPINRSILDEFGKPFGSDSDDDIDDIITVPLDSTSLGSFDMSNVTLINGQYTTPLLSGHSTASAAEESLLNYLNSTIPITAIPEPSPYDKETQNALNSPVAPFADCFRLYKQSTSIQSAISPWDFEPHTPNQPNNDFCLIEEQALDIPALTPSKLSPTAKTFASPARSSSFSIHRPPSRLKLIHSSTDPTTGSFSSVSTIQDIPHANRTYSLSHTTQKNNKHHITFGSYGTNDLGSPTSAGVEMSEGIPDNILKTRLKRYKPLSIDLVTETKTVHVAEGDTKDIFVTSLISVKVPPRPQPNDDPYLNQPEEVDSKVRAQLTAHVKQSISDWKEKKLEVSQFGNLRLHDRFFVSMDQQKWQLLDCYLFDTILIFVRTFPNNSLSPRRDPVLKGSVAIRSHLISITLPPSSYPPIIPGSSNAGPQILEHFMTLNLSTERLPTLFLKSQDPISIENWYTALMNWDHKFSLTRLVSADDYAGQSIASQMYSEESAPDSFRAPISSHIPADVVILVPMSGSPQGAKFPAIKEALKVILTKMQLFDRIALVPYGGLGVHNHNHHHHHLSSISSASGSTSSSFSSKTGNLYGLASSDWEPWISIIESLKATGSRGSRSEMIEGLHQALNILQDRRTLNPVASIFVISDSAAGSTSFGTGLEPIISDEDGYHQPPVSPTYQSDIKSIVRRATSENITIHSIGVTMNHLADDLDVLSTKTSGSYHYLRGWNELCDVIVGTFASSQSLSYSDVSLSIGTTSLFGIDEEVSLDTNINDDIIIAEISGHNHIRVPISQSEPLQSPLSPSPSYIETLPPQQCVQEHLVELGDMSENQERTFLVQVRVRPEAIMAKLQLQQQQQVDYDDSSSIESSEQEQLELFHASLSYKGFATNPYSTGNVYMLPVGGALIPVESCEADLAFPIMDEFFNSHGGFHNDRASFMSRVSSYYKYRLGGSTSASRNSCSSSIYSLYNSGQASSIPSLSESANALDLAYPPSSSVASSFYPPNSSSSSSNKNTVNETIALGTSQATRKNSWYMSLRRSNAEGYPEFPGKPSILFGDLVPRPRKEPLADSKSFRNSTPTYLALELYDVRVVLRRIELTTVNLFQYIVRADLDNSLDDEGSAQSFMSRNVYKNISEARALIQGLYACSVAMKRDATSGKKKPLRIISDEWQAEAQKFTQKKNASNETLTSLNKKKLSSREKEEEESLEEFQEMCAAVAKTKALVAAIEKVLDIVCEHLEKSNLYVLQQDFRKVLLQYIGVLRNQKAYTKRSQIEQLYYLGV